jgi:hypothetical protein
MSLADLPDPVATFFRALEARDPEALSNALGPHATVGDGGEIHRGAEACSRWCALETARPQPFRLLQSESQRARAVVTTLSRVDGTRAAAHTRWSFALEAGVIAALTITDVSGPEIPEPAAAFVHATNRGELEALLATFAEDALVNDQLREYCGGAVIAEWAVREVIAQRLSLTVQRVKVTRDQVSVTASIDGNFERRGLPDPLLVTFYFSARNGKIDQLLILPNEFVR